MTHSGRVVWSEGLFLRPQHFQQQDRWTDALVRSATQGLRHNGWGFRELELEHGLLAQGKLAIRRASGTMPDGTVFAFPQGGPCPVPIEVPAAAQTVVHLALPVQIAGSAEIDAPGREPSGARYAAREIELRDGLAHAEGVAAPVHVAELRFRLLHDAAPRD